MSGEDHRLFAFSASHDRSMIKLELWHRFWQHESTKIWMTREQADDLCETIQNVLKEGGRT